jgi:hypothetical protein
VGPADRHRAGSIPVWALLRKAGEAIYALFFPGSNSDREEDENRAFEKLSPVAWGLKGAKGGAGEEHRAACRLSAAADTNMADRRGATWGENPLRRFRGPKERHRPITFLDAERLPVTEKEDAVMTTGHAQDGMAAR